MTTPPPVDQTSLGAPQPAGAGFRLIGERARRTIAGLAVLGAVTATVANAAMGYAVGLLPGERAPVNLFLLTLVAIVGAIFLRDAVFMAIATEVEDANHRYRLSVLRLLRRLDLRTLERIGPAAVTVTVAANVRKISDTASQVGMFVTLIARLLCGLLVIVVLSPVAFAVVALVLVVLVASVLVTTRPALAGEEAAQAAEGAFFAGLTHLVRGFKALKLNQPMGGAFAAAELDAPAHRAMAAKTAAGRWLALNFVLSNAAKLLAAATVVFLIPWLVAGTEPHPELIAAVVMIALLPVAILQQSPVVIRAGAALGSLKDFIDRLSVHASAPPEVAPTAGTTAAPVGRFRSLAVERLEYRFTDRTGQPGFRVGPLDFAIPAGSLTFIVGGNGSGKTTLLKLLTGLYRPTGGAIRINGVAADPAVRSRYGSAVFADPFLFRRLYGVADADPAEVAEVLARLGIDHVTGYDRTRGFTNLDLSTGQRKRLALAVALLERRPVLFLDEFAADQDPRFRRAVYTELLPRLRAEGRTVVAVTHDDAWFAVADRVLAMEDGRLRVD